jgi:hypothetical protein
MLIWANLVWVITLLTLILTPLKLAWSLQWTIGFLSIGWPWIQLAALSMGFWWSSTYACEGEIGKSMVCSVLSGGALFSVVLGYLHL